MKKILVILSLFLCACNNNADNAKISWDKMVDDLARQEYEDCLNYSVKEFDGVALSNVKQTCKCVFDYLYMTDAESDDRYATNLSVRLKEMCGDNIPAYILRNVSIE